MADNDGVIRSKIIIDVTQAEEQFRTLSAQMKELKLAHEKSLSSENNGSAMFNGAVQSTKDLQRQIVILTDSMRELKNLQSAGISESIERTNVAAQKKIYTDQDAAIKEHSNAIKEQMKTDVAYDKYVNNLATKYNKQDAKADTKTSGVKQTIPLQSYSSQISGLTKQSEEFYQKWKTIGTTAGKLDFINAKTQIKALSLEQETFNKAIDKSKSKMYSMGDSVEYMGAKLRSHMAWIVSGAVIGAAVGLPAAVINSIQTLDEAMAGVRQVIQPLEKDQAGANKELQVFIEIASQYGASANEVVDAGRSWGRMYKDLAVVNLLVAQSAKMSIADNFALAESVKGLESAMAQFGMKSQDINEIQVNSNRILDVWTKLSHNAGVSANDLTLAVERAGSAAHATGVSFEFFNSLVAAGVRNTARSGAEIGQTLKTVFSSIHSKKAIEEIQSMGVEIYKTSADGTRSFRSVQDVLLDVALVTQSTTKDTEALNLAISGGKFQWSKASAIFGDYKEILANWELTVNSAGFTNEQVGVQMDTLARRVKTLKAEFDGLATNTGSLGMLDELKGTTESLSNFTRGIKEASPTLMTMAHYAVLAAAAYGILSKVITAVGFNEGVEFAAAQMATGVKKEQILVTEILDFKNTSLATSTLNVARAEGVQAAMAGKVTQSGTLMAIATGNWVTLLALAAYSIYEVVAAQGAQSRAQDIANGKSQEANDILVQQINNNKQRNDFIDTLAGRYSALSKEIDANSGSTKSNSEKTAQQGVILETLARQLGTTTDELLKDGVLQVDKINEIKKARDAETRGALQNNIDKMITEIQATQQFIDNCNTRIDSIKTEMTDVGLLGKAYQWLMSVIAQKQLAAADELDAYADGKINTTDYAPGAGAAGQFPAGWTPSDNQKDTAHAQAEEDRRIAGNTMSRAGQTGIDYYTGQIANANQKAKVARDEIARLQAQIGVTDNEKPKEQGEAPTDKATKPKAEKLGAKTPDDHAEAIKRMQDQAAYKALLADIDIAEKKHQDTLAATDTQEAIHGKTVELTMEKQRENLAFIATVGAEYNSLETLKQGYIEQLNTELATNAELNSTVSEAIPNWTALTKTQQREQVGLNTELFQTYKTANALNSLISEIGVKQAGLHSKNEGSRNELTKENLGGTQDVVKQSNRRLAGISDNESISISQTRNPLDEQNETKLWQINHDALLAKQVEYDAQVAYLKEQADKEAKEAIAKGDEELQQETEDALKKALVAQATNNAAIVQSARDKDAKIRQSSYAVVDDLLLKGKSAKDIWKNLWAEMAEDALKSLLKIGNGSGGLLSQIFGRLSGGSNTSSSSSADLLTTPVTSLSSLFKAKGDIVDSPVIAGEDGAEAIIPLEKNTGNSANLLRLAAKKLGISTSTNVTASVSQKTQDTAQATSQLATVNSAHLDKLDTQIGLMTQQNSMIMTMMESGGQGGTTALQPIVMSAAQSNDDLQSQINNMRRQGYSL